MGVFGGFTSGGSCRPAASGPAFLPYEAGTGLCRVTDFRCDFPSPCQVRRRSAFPWRRSLIPPLLGSPRRLSRVGQARRRSTVVSGRSPLVLSSPNFQPSSPRARWPAPVEYRGAALRAARDRPPRRAKPAVEDHHPAIFFCPPLRHVRRSSGRPMIDRRRLPPGQVRRRSSRRYFRRSRCVR